MTGINVLQRIGTGRIDICLLQVTHGGKKGFWATWCAPGADVINLIKERHEKTVDLNRGRWSPDIFDTYDYWFPGATSGVKAERHFKELVAASRNPNISFESKVTVSEKEIAELLWIQKSRKL